jgi:hypothetical protein
MNVILIWQEFLCNAQCNKYFIRFRVVRSQKDGGPKVQKRWKNPIIPATSGGRKPASELLYIFLSRLGQGVNSHFTVILLAQRYFWLNFFLFFLNKKLSPPASQSPLLVD